MFWILYLKILSLLGFSLELSISSAVCECESQGMLEKV